MNVQSTQQRFRLIARGLLCIAVSSPGAEVTVALSGVNIVPPNVSINSGDTVTWVGGAQYDVHVIESYTGEFKSPFLAEEGSRFSYAFQEPGTYAYRNFVYTGQAPNYTRVGGAFFGTVTVVPSTNNPAAVTINTPPNDFHFGWIRGESEWISILASVTNHPSQIARVEFYSGTNFLGAATDAPLQLTWTTAPVGTHLLTARAVDLSNSIADSRPVMITVEEASSPRLHSLRILRGGVFAFDYVALPIAARYYIHSLTDLNVRVATVLKQVKGSGTFISEINPGQTQFFWIQERF